MLIGLAGQAGAGKDAVADILVREHSFVKVAFADPIKRSAADWFGWDKERLWGPSEKRNEDDPAWPGLSARKALQLMGTEVGRALHEEVWVRYAIRIAQRLQGSGVLRSVHYDYTPEEGLTVHNTPQRAPIKGVVISDVRFTNELQLLRDAHFKTVRVIRKNRKTLAAKYATHQSETEQDEIPDNRFDALLLNSGVGLEDLAVSTGTLLEALALSDLLGDPLSRR